MRQFELEGMIIFKNIEKKCAYDHNIEKEVRNDGIEKRSKLCSKIPSYFLLRFNCLFTTVQSNVVTNLT